MIRDLVCPICDQAAPGVFGFNATSKAVLIRFGCDECASKLILERRSLVQQRPPEPGDLSPAGEMVNLDVAADWALPGCSSEAKRLRIGWALTEPSSPDAGKLREAVAAILANRTSKGVSELLGSLFPRDMVVLRRVEYEHFVYTYDVEGESRIVGTIGCEVYKKLQDAGHDPDAEVGLFLKARCVLDSNRRTLWTRQDPR